MTNTNLVINGISLFCFCSALTYLGFRENFDWTAVRVWDQFKDSLKAIDPLSKNGSWESWAERWANLVNRNSSNHSSEQLQSDYFKTTVLSETNKDLLKKSGKTDDAEKVNWAKDKNNRKDLYASIKKLQDECKWAYGRYINRTADHEKSWFYSWQKRTNSKNQNDEENYKYWNDVYLVCKEEDKPLPPDWLSKDSALLYFEFYKPQTTTAAPTAASK